MFDKELTEIVLKYKEEELQNEQQQPVNQNKIDELNKEIKYIKAILIRYEIAVLLKLDKDEKYNVNNFFGIEEEDINNYNLTKDELDKYNQLVSQLPVEQLQRYKIRKKISEILGQNIDDKYKTNDYYDIENTDPNSANYNLSQEQITEFNDLVNQIKQIADDTTKSISFKEEAIKILENAYKSINIEDIDKYNQIKAPYLETIDKLLNKVDEERRKSLFLDVSNYKLAQDLLKKYPNINLKMNLKAIEKLLKKIDLKKISDDDYNEYLDLLCKNIVTLYEEDSNKEKIENMLKNINKKNYILRNELDSKLENINNINFDLLDSELEEIVNYLNEKYDLLDEKERDAYYNLIETKIIKESNNLDKANYISNILLSITNKNLSERLHSKLSSNENLQFNNQHLSSYQLLIDEEIKKLQDKKNKYLSKKPSSGFLSAHYEIKIKEIDKEIEELKAMQADYEKNSLLKRLDSKYNKKTDKIVELKQEIEELQTLKSQITSKFHQRIIDKKIKKREQKIKSLKASKVNIIGSQKRIMTPKLWLNRKKNMISRHFESKVETFKEYAENYTKMAQTERQLGGMFSNIKAMFYEFKASRYESKAKFNLKICNLLNNAKVKIKGSNKKILNNNKLKQIRQKYQQKQAVPVI